MFLVQFLYLFVVSIEFRFDYKFSVFKEYAGNEFTFFSSSVYSYTLFQYLFVVVVQFLKVVVNGDVGFLVLHSDETFVGCDTLFAFAVQNFYGIQFQFVAIARSLAFHSYQCVLVESDVAVAVYL